MKINNPGFLVLGHNLNNNWKVKINGRKDEHIQANLVQRAVYLPKADTYVIEFYYFSEMLLIGLIISCASLFIFLFLTVYLKFKEKVNLKYYES